MANDEWETPRGLFERLAAEFGPFDLDAAATAENALCDRYITGEQDGLRQPWHIYATRVWCNPPYSRGAIDQWVQKGYEESLAGCRVVMLVKADPSTRWWRQWANRAALRIELGQRVRFGQGGQAGTECPPWPSAVLVFDEALRVPQVRAGL